MGTERSSTRTNGRCRAASQRHDDRQWLKTQRMCGGTSQGGDRCYAGNVVRVALTHLQIMCETLPRSVKIRAYAWLASLVTVSGRPSLIALRANSLAASSMGAASAIVGACLGGNNASGMLAVVATRGTCITWSLMYCIHLLGAPPCNR